MLRVAVLMVGVVCCLESVAREVSSQISDVVLYRSGATLTRTAELPLSAGESEITFIGLPSYLSDDGLQLEVADKRVKLGQVKVKSLVFRGDQNPEVLALQSQIEAKQLEIQANKDSSKAAELQLSFLKSLASGYSKDAWIGAAQAQADINSWRQALSLLDTGSASAYKTLRENKLLLIDLEKDLAKLRAELGQLRGTGRAGKVIVASFAAPEAINTQVSLRYFQANAGWSPSYAARLNSESGKLLLSQKADIYQSTQEEWRSVKVTLSTSQPSEEMEAPDVSSVFYKLRPKVEARSYSKVAAAPAPMQSAQADMMLEEIAVTASRVPEPAPEWSGDFALNFEVPGRIDISNKASESQSFDVAKFEFDAELLTQVVPLLDTQAYLAARFTHDGKTTLFGSDMLVYVDGVLMGRSQMPTILPGAETTLPMGIDKLVEVEVTDLGGQGGDRGVINKQQTQVRDLQVAITSRRSGDNSVEVRMAYPVSKDRDVRVKIDKKATEPSEQNVDDLAGVMLWKKQLTRDDPWTINYAFTLSYPADRELQQVWE